MAHLSPRSGVSFSHESTSRVSSARPRPQSAGSSRVREFNQGDFSPRHKMTIGIPRRGAGSLVRTEAPDVADAQELKLELQLDQHLIQSILEKSKGLRDKDSVSGGGRSGSNVGSVSTRTYDKAASQRSGSATSRRKFTLDVAATRNSNIYIDWNKEYSKMDRHPVSLPVSTRLMSHRGSLTARSARSGYERPNFSDQDTHESVQLQLESEALDQPRFVRYFKKADQFVPSGKIRSQADERVVDDVYDFKLEQRRAVEEYEAVCTQQRRQKELTEFRSKSVERLLRAADRGEPFAILRLQHMLNPSLHKEDAAASVFDSSYSSKPPATPFSQAHQTNMDAKKVALDRLKVAVSLEDQRQKHWDGIQVAAEQDLRATLTRRRMEDGEGSYRPSTADTVRSHVPRLPMPPRAASEMGMSEVTEDTGRRRRRPAVDEGGGVEGMEVLSVRSPKGPGKKGKSPEFDFESDVRNLEIFDRKIRLQQKALEAERAAMKRGEI